MAGKTTRQLPPERPIRADWFLYSRAGSVVFENDPQLPDGTPVEVFVMTGSAGTPAAVLEAMSKAPHLGQQDVAELLQEIEHGKRPVRVETGTPPAVSLRKVVEESDTCMSDEWRAFLNRTTGETLQLEQAVLSAAEDGDEESLEDWQREELTMAVEILDSKEWLELPGSFDIHEWQIMRDYCGTVDDDAVHQELLRAIHGRGAFRCFKDTVHRRELVDSWYAFRDSAICKIVGDWLTGQGVEFAE